MLERTLFVIKPDAVKRGIAGEIIQRVERMGFVIKAAKLVQIDEKLGEAHYPNSEEWLRTVGERTIEDCNKYGVNLMENMGTEDPIEIGKIVKKWNVDFLCSGPVFAFVLEGLNAVERLRSLTGHTIPVKAAIGTIRGDYAMDSAIAANIEKRTIHNLVHASGTVDEAKNEIDLWFKKEEILD